MHLLRIYCRKITRISVIQRTVGCERGRKVAKIRWEEEKEAFHATPRRPQWKEDKWKEAINHQKGAIRMLLDHVGIVGLDQNKITGALWRKIQSLAIAVEGELKTKDGKLMGRLDLLMADVDSW